MRRLCWTVGTLLGVTLLTGPARAQEEPGGMALSQLEPTPAGDRFFGVPSASTSGRLVPRGILVFDYADRPLVLANEDAAAQDSVVRGQAFLHVDASLAIQDRLLISALLPIAILQRSGDASSDAKRAIESAEVGDLRLGARVRLIGEDGGPAQVAVGTYVHVPTGADASFAAEGAARVTPHATVSGRLGIGSVPFDYAAMFGAAVRGSQNPSALIYGAGVAASLFSGRVQAGPEIYASSPIQERAFSLTGGDDEEIARSDATNVELLFGVRVNVLGGLVAGWAAGPGLTRGVGTPGFRIAGMFGWTPPGQRADATSPSDADGDGIKTADDRCPFAAGTAAHEGCPVLDDDEDGVPNDRDACPDKPGADAADAKLRGCPAPPPNDRDADGVPDASDACADRAGLPSDDAKRTGCPPEVGDKER